MDWDKLPARYKNELDLQITKDILLFFNVEVTETPGFVEERINKRYYVTNHERTVHEDLQSFIDLDEPCTGAVINRAMQICLILHHDEDGALKGFAKFLMEVGKKKLSICAARVVGKGELETDTPGSIGQRNSLTFSSQPLWVWSP